MADQEQKSEVAQQQVHEGHRVGRKSPAANASVWRPDMTTLRADFPLTPQEINFPNDSAHHV